MPAFLFYTLAMHVLVKLALLVLLAVVVGVLPPKQLLILAVAICSVSFFTGKANLLRTLRRVRWLLLMMLCVYFFGTPGQYILLPSMLSQAPTWLRPSYEGVQQGLMQTAKIVAVLSALSLLLSTTTRSALISALYQLMRIFSWTGIDAERFASRLWLTLHYAENQEKQALSMQGITQVFDEIMLENEHSPHQAKEITLDIIPVTLVDKCILLCVLMSLCWLVWY